MDHKRRLWPWIVATLLMVLVVYPLSLGPATWLYGKDCVSGETLDVIYGPVFAVCYGEQSPEWLDDALWWYTRLWAVKKHPDH